MSAPEIASASVPETLASLKVNPETGLARAEVDVRRQQNGYNEVAATKRHPVLKFLGKFCLLAHVLSTIIAWSEPVSNKKSPVYFLFSISKLALAQTNERIKSSFSLT